MDRVGGGIKGNAYLRKDPRPLSFAQRPVSRLIRWNVCHCLAFGNGPHADAVTSIPSSATLNRGAQKERRSFFTLSSGKTITDHSNCGFEAVFRQASTDRRINDQLHVTFFGPDVHVHYSASRDILKCAAVFGKLGSTGSLPVSPLYRFFLYGKNNRPVAGVATLQFRQNSRTKTAQTKPGRAGRYAEPSSWRTVCPLSWYSKTM